jgi:DNA-binding TFAR19-related protein (PDSD5 family)
MIKFPEMEFAFARWFVPMAKDALLGKDTGFEAIKALTAKKNALQGKIDAMLDLVTSGIVSNEAKQRLSKLALERDAIDNEIVSVKANQVQSANIPATIERLDAIVEGVLDNQAVRKQVADVIPGLVKDVEVDLADKCFPSFTVRLINGETVTWRYDAIEYGQSFVKSKDGKYRLGQPYPINGNYVIKE